MRKAIVIGCPGSGKSTFSRALRDKTGLPLYYLDMLFHRPDRTTVSKKEFDRRLSEILETDRWIIDGSYSRTLELRLEACDTVFLFDLPVELCLAGAESRIGRKREDLPWVELEFDGEFRQWIADYPRDQMPGIYELLEMYKGKRDIFVFKTREEAGEYLNTAFGGA